MGHQYGRSQAAALIDGEDFEAAVTAASEAIARDGADSEAFFERATALAWLEKYDEAIGDFEQAKQLDRATQVIEDDVLDDAYFSALLGAARARDVAAGCTLLDRYATQYPAGRHNDDAADWQKRLRGELKSAFVKER